MNLLVNSKVFFLKLLFSIDEYRSPLKDILALRLLKCMNCVGIYNRQTYIYSLTLEGFSSRLSFLFRKINWYLCGHRAYHLESVRRDGYCLESARRDFPNGRNVSIVIIWQWFEMGFSYFPCSSFLKQLVIHFLEYYNMSTRCNH